MAQFTVTGVKDDELEWLKERAKENRFPVSIEVRNLINEERKRESRAKVKK
jgi:hypothetical protein